MSADQSNIYKRFDALPRAHSRADARHPVHIVRKTFPSQTGGWSNCGPATPAPGIIRR